VRKINVQEISDVVQTSVSCIKELVLAYVIIGIEPLFFQFSPECFSNIQMWRIRRKIKEEQSSTLPIRDSFLNILRFMQPGIIQNNERILMNLKRKLFQIIHNKLSVNVLFRCLPVTPALSVNHAKTVYFIRFFAQNANLFILKLPAVWNISLTAYMRFISVIKVYFSIATQFLKFSKPFNPLVIILRYGFPFASESYTFISSANLFKKCLNVSRLTDLPLLASHSALAVSKRWRLALMASKMADLSSDSFISGLRPRPGLVCKPEMPSDLYRFSQLFTLTLLIPVIRPVSSEVRPSDLSNMLWQRILKQWLFPCFKPDSNACRCSPVRTGVLTRPIWGTKIQNNIN